MAQYAQFDPKASQPAPVLGWYDTDQFNYRNLPAAEGLITLNSSQWALHYNNPHAFAVLNGKLIDIQDKA